MTDSTIRKYKSDLNTHETAKKKKVWHWIILHVNYKNAVERSYRTSQWQWYHLTSLILRSTKRIVFWSYLLVGDELSNATGIDCLFVSLALSTPKIILIRNDEILYLLWDCCQNVGKKIVRLIFEARSTRNLKNIIGRACVQLCYNQRVQFSSANSQKRRGPPKTWFTSRLAQIGWVGCFRMPNWISLQYIGPITNIYI